MDISFEKVSYTYQPNTPFAHQALKNLSFTIPKKSFTAIIGHTGSGKSTLLQHLNGLIRPTEGKVTIGPYTLTKAKKETEMKQLRSEVGVVFQYPEHQLFEETIEKDIAFGPMNFGVSESEIKERIKKIMPQVGLDASFLERSPFELSGGQMRRVAIAGVLAIKPKIYVLDEPTAGLDPKGQKEIMDMFQSIHEEENATTILVTHSMEDALKYADYLIILNKGELYMQGRPEEIFTQKEALEKVQLQVPQSIEFIQQFNEKFGAKLPLTIDSIDMLASQIQATFK